MAELKPCPFCGGTVSIAKSGDNGMMWWFVTRGKGANPCKCRVFMESEDFAISEDIERKLKLKKDLIEAWNRRTKIETNIYDKEETYHNCTVQVLTNTVTGDVSVGWWKNGGNEDGK